MSLFLGEGVAFCKFVKHNISHTSPREVKGELASVTKCGDILVETFPYCV